MLDVKESVAKLKVSPYGRRTPSCRKATEIEQILIRVGGDNGNQSSSVMVNVARSKCRIRMSIRKPE